MQQLDNGDQSEWLQVRVLVLDTTGKTLPPVRYMQRAMQATSYMPCYATGYSVYPRGLQAIDFELQARDFQIQARGNGVWALLS